MEPCSKKTYSYKSHSRLFVLFVLIVQIDAITLKYLLTVNLIENRYRTRDYNVPGVLNDNLSKCAAKQIQELSCGSGWHQELNIGEPSWKVWGYLHVLRIWRLDCQFGYRSVWVKYVEMLSLKTAKYDLTSAQIKCILVLSSLCHFKMKPNKTHAEQIMNVTASIQ